MILLKFIFWVMVAWFALFLFARVAGPWLSRRLMKFVMRKAQEDMNKSSQTYQQQAQGYTPFEDSVYVEDGIKVSIRRGKKEEKSTKEIDPEMIEEVEYEDID